MERRQSLEEVVSGDGTEEWLVVMQRVDSEWASWHECRWLYWAPVVAYAALIFYMSSLPHPGNSLPDVFSFFNDKAVHLVEYGVLSILLYRAFRWGAGPQWAPQAWWVAVIVAVLYGVSDEIHQSFVPPREMDPYDVVADGIGALSATQLWRWITER
ncbi:MAG: VanZ family protein [Nitrospiraceae bacterium]